MKKNLLLTIALTAIINMGLFAQKTIVGWTFPDNVTDSLADVGLEGEINKRCILAEDTAAWKADYKVIRQTEYKNGATTKAAAATGWDNGANAKLWSIKFKALDYVNLKVSAKLSSAENKPGPKDWKIQAMKKGGDWVDLKTDLTIDTEWTTGAVTDLALPSEFDTCGSSIFIRWIMTSNLDVNGNPVEATGTVKIDDILVTGDEIEKVSGLNNTDLVADLQVFPNPASDFVTIKSSSIIEAIEIVDICGKTVKQLQFHNSSIKVNISNLPTGVYFIKTVQANSSATEVRQLMIK